MVNATGPQATLRDLKAASFAEQDVLCRHTNIFENNLRMTARSMVVAEDRQCAFNCHAWSIERHQNHRLLLMNRSRRIRLAHENGDLAPRVTRAGGPPFMTIDDIIVAAMFDPRPDIGGIR